MVVGLPPEYILASGVVLVPKEEQVDTSGRLDNTHFRNLYIHFETFS